MRRITMGDINEIVAEIAEFGVQLDSEAIILRKTVDFNDGTHNSRSFETLGKAHDFLVGFLCGVRALHTHARAANKELQMKLGELPPDHDFLQRHGVLAFANESIEDYRWSGCSWQCVLDSKYPGGPVWVCYKFDVSMMINFEIQRENDDGDIEVYDYAPTLDLAKAACIENGRIEAGETLWIVERTPGREPNKVVRTWVPNDEEHGTGTWAVGDAYRAVGDTSSRGCLTIWFDEQGNKHHHEE